MAGLMYLAAAILVLGLHLGFILWVIFGAFFTRERPLLACVHIASFIWGLVIEIFPWTCPLTFAENWLEQRAGIAPYSGGFLLHYLDALIYPNLPPMLLTMATAVVFVANVAVYWRRFRRRNAQGA
jgi:uncharacterized protein DUF2784